MESGASLASDEVMAQSLPASSHHHRHFRYATPETSAPPHFILAATSNNHSHRSRSHNHRASSRASRTMSATPPPPLALPSLSQPQPLAIPDPEPGPSGQDHDRMETDEGVVDSDGPDSEEENHTPVPSSRDLAIEVAPQPSAEDGVMDTSPDHPPSQDIPPQAPGDPHVEPHLANSTGESDDRHAEQVHNTQGDDAAAETSQPGDARSLEIARLHRQILAVPGVEDLLRAQEERFVLEGIAENTQAQAGFLQRQLLSVTGVEDPGRAREENDEREGVTEDAEADEDSDDSTDEDEQPYWVNLREDTSTPDERELKAIEEVDEISALDHDHWEKLSYEPLNDPEYVPRETGRITWTVKGVHGTPEKPNMKKIMRSPPVLIGGYYWNIKYYPHGDEGTEQLSIYIECSPSPPASVETEGEEAVASIPKGDVVEAESAESAVANGASSGESSTTVYSVHQTSAPAASELNIEATVTPPETTEQNDQQSWGTAAQISCVLYNPEEPRVHAFQKGCHRYYNDSPDWGWTRFHGPWDEIHRRQRNQRQALLRNDTLSFTAYIRTVEDPTNALFWHPPKDKPEWDSGAMIGVNSIACPCHHSSALVAAVSSWMHLTPIARLVRNVGSPDPVMEPHSRMRPAYKAFQNLYDEASRPSHDNPISLRSLGVVLDYHLANTKRDDVVAIWEALRRILNYEASGLDGVKEGNDIEQDRFNEILILKQPDEMDLSEPDTKYLISPRAGAQAMSGSEPHSVQEALNKAAHKETFAFRTWRSFEGQDQHPPINPQILQIELHRQEYDPKRLQWNKLTHRITIDETVTFNDCEYTLYGLVAHTGDLESKEFYSVIRPEGPGTRWIRFAGEYHEGEANILTYKQAVHAHEGSDDNRVGRGAVAQVVMYARTNSLPEALCTPFKQVTVEPVSAHEATESLAAKDDEMTDSKDPERSVPVFIFSSESFLHHSGRGICDPWILQRQQQFVQEILFPASTTLAEVRDFVADPTAQKIPTTSEVRLWPINASLVEPISRDENRHDVTFPSLLSHKAHLESTIDEIGQDCQGCRFWMTISEKAPAPTPEATLSGSTSGDGSAREYEQREVALQAIIASLPFNDAEAAPQQADTEMTSDGNVPQASEYIREETERERRRRQQQLLRQLQQAQEQTRQQAAHQAQERRLQNERNAQALKETYFLVKVFDMDTQSLRGVGGAVVKSESNIIEETKKLLGVEASEDWIIFHEACKLVRCRDEVKVHETFQSKCGGADGTIIIAQRRPDDLNKTADFIEEGKSVDLHDYCHYLHGLYDDPTQLADHMVLSYFGHPYYSMSLKGGRPHGPGVVITLNGDAYHGEYISGHKHNQGTMSYANGDTYSGEWCNDAPDGQGRMVYGKTGNVYTGGFRMGKRFGEGTMVFKVADEQENLCSICYEDEINALFYDCGHVTACEDCARQLDVCPVCRKNVRAVVRMWKV